MNKKKVYVVLASIILAFLAVTFWLTKKDLSNPRESIKHVVGIILKSEDGNVTLEDENDNLLIFDESQLKEKIDL